MIRDFRPVAPGLPSGNVREWFEKHGDPAEPVAPRHASTVMLLRDGAAGPEVFVLRRVSSMAFAPLMTVFPGGGVDPRDAEGEVPWAGPSVAEWAGLLDTDEATARLLVCAAVREVFEECGVLLAGPDDDSVVADVSGPQWHAARLALESRQRSLTEVLTEAGLVLRTDRLSYRAHWITPVFEPRRYDTRFFAARLPAGQHPDDATSETDQVRWVRAQDLLDEAEAGDVLLLPPTVVTLEQLAAQPSVDAYAAAVPAIRPVCPVLRLEGDRLLLRADLP